MSRIAPPVGSLYLISPPAARVGHVKAPPLPYPLCNEYQTEDRLPLRYVTLHKGRDDLHMYTGVVEEMETFFHN